MKKKNKVKCFDEMTYYKYADNELNPRELQVVKDHLKNCASCRVFAADIEAENSALKELFSGAADCPDLTPNLMERLNKKGFSRLSRRSLTYAATFLLTVFLLVFLFFNKQAGSRQEAHHVMVQSARVEGQSAQPHIFASKNPDVAFIWLEKAETEKGETEGNNETTI